MSVERRHLHIVLLLLVAAVGYNVWTFTRGPRSRVAEPPEPLLSDVLRPGRSAGAMTRGAADPLSIPPPPPVDLAREPAWSRDPLLGAEESRRPPETVEAARTVEAAEPQVRTILYSTRRQLAIVDDRIVRVGDTVATGSRIVEIQPDAIVVEDVRGTRTRVAVHRGPSLRERPGGR